jgi:hypothetical protein
MQKKQKLISPLTKSVRKMKISAGTGASSIITQTNKEPNPSDYISNLLNPDLLIKISKEIPIGYLKNFMQVNKYVNESLRSFLPTFIREHFIPKTIRSRAALEVATNDALLNPNTLHTMSFPDFLIQVRPALKNWPYLRQHYIEKFETLIRSSDDNDEKKLLNLKRISLIYIDFTQEDIERFIEIQTFNYRGMLVIYPEYIGIAQMSFEEFMRTIRPFIVQKFNENDKMLYINNLQSLINDTYNRWQGQPRDQEEWDQYEIEMNNVTKYGDIITSIRHPEYSEEEITEHRRDMFTCEYCNTGRH